MAYAMFSGGKRLRPALTFLAFKAAGGTGGAALGAATAVELVHGFSLVHDDLPCLDDSPLRRGRPSVHRQFDEATALLAGDALLALAFEILSRPVRGWPPERGPRIALVLARAAGAAGMMGGQAAERELAAPSLSALARVHGLKTGRLFEAAALAGAYAAGATPPVVVALRRYARALGLAFQIADDLLDYTPAEEGAADSYPGVLGRGAAEEALAQAESAAVRAAGRLGGGTAPLAAALARYAAARRS
jgi:geranylgeranyl pyrophosphate synthase